jgi:hypothetical protein
MRVAKHQRSTGVLGPCIVQQERTLSLAVGAVQRCSPPWLAPDSVPGHMQATWAWTTACSSCIRLMARWGRLGRRWETRPEQHLGIRMLQRASLTCVSCIHDNATPLLTTIAQYCDWGSDLDCVCGRECDCDSAAAKSRPIKPMAATTGCPEQPCMLGKSVRGFRSWVCLTPHMQATHLLWQHPQRRPTSVLDKVPTHSTARNHLVLRHLLVIMVGGASPHPIHLRSARCIGGAPVERWR